MSSGSEDKNWFLMRLKSDADLKEMLSSKDPAEAISDRYVLGDMRQVKRQASPLSPAEPGDVVFNSKKGVIEVHDGRQVQSGIPSYGCPDCDGMVILTRKYFNYGHKSVPWFYACENKDNGCGAMTPARVNGAMVAPPADAETRRARLLTNKQFDRLWKEAPEVQGLPKGATRKAAENKAKARAYRWLAREMNEQGIETRNIPQMSVPELRVAYRICRDANLDEVVGFG